MEETIKKSLNILRDVKEVMPKSFLILGTALGAVRQKSFIINGMFDIDVGIMSEDFKWEYITELVRRGFNIKLVLGKRNFGLSVHLERDDIKTDILLFYRDNNGVWSISWFLNKELHQRFSNDAFVIEENEINGNVFRSLGQKYLEEYYGSNWRIPQDSFDWEKEPKSIEKVVEDKDSISTKFDIYMNCYE
jgi:hypothetical protein